MLSRVRRELVTGVPKVVEVYALQANGLERGHPGAAVEVTVPKWSTLGTGEDKRVVLADGVEVLTEINPDKVREGNEPTTGLGLGRPERVAATRQVVDLASYPDPDTV
jgi:hypothetical protein